MSRHPFAFGRSGAEGGCARTMAKYIVVVSFVVVALGCQQL